MQGYGCLLDFIINVIGFVWSCQDKTSMSLELGYDINVIGFVWSCQDKTSMSLEFYGFIRI